VGQGNGDADEVLWAKAYPASDCAVRATRASGTSGGPVRLREFKAGRLERMDTGSLAESEDVERDCIDCGTVLKWAGDEQDRWHREEVR
jgi:hypothetical protein